MKDLNDNVDLKKQTEDFYSFFDRDPAKLNPEPVPKGMFILGRKGYIKNEYQEYLSEKEYDKTDPTLSFEGTFDNFNNIERQLSWNNRNALNGNPYEIESEDEGYKPRMSFKARMDIFDLYNQGWSVRDLSIRFGAIPPRIKAIVY